MNKREEALIEALRNNAEETERWKAFLKDNEAAKENLSMFQKRLSVDVMVPVGKKALMPGQLIHTNEVLVGHYQGYFSKCSAFKAAEICDLRINTAREHLKKLEVELDLWQNKLEKPYADGVVPSGEERDIIEEFNEEQEQLWKEQHKIRLKEAKEKEKEEREKERTKEAKKQKAGEDEAKEKSNEDIFKMLEDAALLEELEEELQALEVDEVNDETIRKLMSGELHLPAEKKRVAHGMATKENDSENGETPLQINIVKKVSIQDKVPATNNNVVPNPDLTANNNAEEEDEEEEPLPEEVQIIKEQAKFLNNEDQIGFYEYQIEIIRQKLMHLPLRNQEEMNEKIRLITVLEHMEELLDFAETSVGNEELAELGEHDETVKESIKEDENNKLPSIASKQNKGNEKRRISFASEDQTLEFCKNEAVTQMLPEKRDPPKRDIIKLDDDVPNTYEKEVIATSPSPDKKDLIKAKVEQNLQFISETQSKQDFDLVNKILESSMGRTNTLHIKFKHSQQCPSYTTSNENKDSEIPVSPADFYDLYVKSSKVEEPSTLFINSYDGEDLVKAPVLKESDRQQAFEDPKTEFSNPKSILRNKAALEKENHHPESQTENADKKSKKSKKKRTPKEEEENTSAYNKVMNDVVEKPLTEPEPLPAGKFIDAHTPKRRVSRFKQMRQGGTEKT